jgi:hypothetical protein
MVLDAFNKINMASIMQPDRVRKDTKESFPDFISS